MRSKILSTLLITFFSTFSILSAQDATTDEIPTSVESSSEILDVQDETPIAPEVIKEKSETSQRYEDYFPNETLKDIDPSTQANNDRFFSEFMNMLLTLGFIVVLILIVSWLLRKLLNTRIQQANTNSDIKILERRSLSPKATIYLLEIRGKGLAIAETHSGVFNLGEISLTESDEKDSFENVLQKQKQRPPGDIT